MRPRDLWILIGALCLLAGTGIVFLSKQSRAEELHPDGAHHPPAAPTQATMPSNAAAVEAAFPATGDDTIVVAATSTAANGGQRVDTAGWTSGIVRGDIQLAVSVLDRLQSITILVEEARRPFHDANGTFQPPHKYVVAAKLGRGTPTFEVPGIAFSEYPYVVSAYAPGLNGSRRTITIDQNTPLVDDIVLAITPGAPFTILLRDQDAAPCVGLAVRMLPVGEPAGRSARNGTSDNFGSVVFEDVLAGDYQLLTSLAGQSLAEPQTVTVQPGLRIVANRVQGQGHTVIVPRGVPLQLRVSDVRGYGIQDVKVSATATDKTKLTVLEAVTDFGGNVEFPRLTDGVWQIDLHKADYERSSRQLTIKADEPPLPQQVQLIRLR